MHLVFTRMPGESYRRRFRSLLLYLCYVFGAQINSTVCGYSVSWISSTAIQLEQPCFMRLTGFSDSKSNRKMNNNGNEMSTK